MKLLVFLPLPLISLLLVSCSNTGTVEVQQSAATPAISQESTVEQVEVGNPASEIQGASPPEPIRADLDDLGPAPELTNDVWLNVDQPLRLADLRGKVVLLEMWTYG